MTTKDDQAAAFYEDPKNRASAGVAVKRKAPQRLASHVPVRFTKEMIDQVKTLADEDEKTVSAWIRALVEREVTRRMLTTYTDAIHARFVIQRGEPKTESVSVPQESKLALA